MKYDDILLIHMGGLGDMCLSESTFCSLSQHFQKNISALGYPRFFNFFQEYFKAIHSLESAQWLYLFSDYPHENKWKRIAFIGKDRKGELRRKWQAISEEELIFIDMYPDDAFSSKQLAVSSLKRHRDGEKLRNLETQGSKLKTKNSKLTTAPHVEDYQLMQLAKYGVMAMKKEITPRPQNRIILYPEVSITKSKWHYENFVELYGSLKKRGIEVYIIESFGLNLPITDKIIIDDLADVKAFFDTGGIFVSNDSGMAHFAGISGLLTITIFNDFNPAIWHPRGRNISLRLGIDNMDVLMLEYILFQLES